MDKTKIQKQHRLSRTYLKHWAYDHNSEPCVCIYHKAERKIEDIPITEYTITYNEFDLPSENEKEKKHYETTAAFLESMYDKVLRTIENQRRLLPKHEDVLRHFASLFLCRSEGVRAEFIEMLTLPDYKDHFLEEICSFDKEAKAKDLKILLPYFKPGEQLQFIIGIITNHFVTLFRTFKALILEDYNDRGWFSSDLPVILDQQENYSNLITPDTEVYMPLSTKYCIFLFHPNALKTANPLRKSEVNKIHQADEKTHDHITQRVLELGFKSVIIPKQYKSVWRQFLDEQVQ